MFCRAELARLAKLKPTIEAHGARLAVVTLSRPEEAQAFCAERAPGVTCYSDPMADSHHAFGLHRGGLSQMFGPDVWAAGVKATAQGHFFGSLKNEWQMPGVFVIDAQGRVTFAYYSRHAADYPSEATLLKALAQVPKSPDFPASERG